MHTNILQKMSMLICALANHLFYQKHKVSMILMAYLIPEWIRVESEPPFLNNLTSKADV
ncbi:hypothetical protein HMPREF0083_04193 [Aneurinibacillus aneurinilyticus ATCC 12856]|uniref:Uncharacterized protein n=1 Tax=Aneurinibacillus aneurinilyticus ATCC 12856 TaxID=649747 RepID=U1Y6H8_ANEAE|nr:hypothetical protein HMPREF0083_04193 [Aneurinibacillus aneurinilyticus ATCC 12856]